MILNAWWLLLITVPVLLLGEWVQRKWPVLHRFNIPVPVIGGMLMSLVVLGLNVSGVLTLSFNSSVTAGWWTWLVTPEVQWVERPARGVNLPFLVGFFACIGLNATWRVVRQGSWQLPLFLGLATLMAVFQNVIGIGLAKAMGESPLLGLMCGSLSQTGGHGTALGFAQTMMEAGFAEAATVGAAAATFGLVCGSLLGGPVGASLIRRHKLKTPMKKASGEATGAGMRTGESASVPVVGMEAEGADLTMEEEGGLVRTWQDFARFGRKACWHVLGLAVVIKAGSWISFGMQELGVIFPSYMGAMILAVVVRNVLDGLGLKWIDSHIVDLMGALLLGIFLAMAMTSLNLAQLATTAGPMLVILGAQAMLTAVFTIFVTFRFMGRDYDAAVMAAGHCGFAMGATPSAVANMDACTRRFGPAHRAFIIVPTVGAVLIDFTNALNITWFLNQIS